jgi:hypothetical protein
MPPGGVKSRTNKRVLAEQHPQHDQVSRATRSKKNYAAQVLGQRDLGEGEPNTLPPTELPQQPAAVVAAATTEESIRNTDVQSQEGILISYSYFIAKIASIMLLLTLSHSFKLKEMGKMEEPKMESKMEEPRMEATRMMPCRMKTLKMNKHKMALTLKVCFGLFA